MNELMTISKALEIASIAHSGQTDLGGNEYILHPLEVWYKVRNECKDTQIVAILHDVVEDSNYTIPDLVKLGLSLVATQALELMTHDKTELKKFLKSVEAYKHDAIKEAEYLEYVVKISKNPIARKVKMADIEHNSCIHRIPVARLSDPKKTGERLVKYARAMEILKKAGNV